jgi:hypothetical protein
MKVSVSASTRRLSSLERSDRRQKSRAGIRWELVEGHQRHDVNILAAIAGRCILVPKEIAMKRSAFVVVWVGTAMVAVFGQAPSPPSGSMLDSKRLIVQPESLPLTDTTNLFGDPSKNGTYVIRTRIAPNTKTRPRFYDQDRWVTVLKGTWWVGEGEVFRPEKVVPVREGGIMYQPASLKTFDITGSSEVILQITGIGPIKPTHAEVDIAGMPVPVGGPYPEDLAAGEGGGRYGRNRGRRGQPPPQTQPDKPAQDPNDPDQNPKPVRLPS